MVKVFEIGKIYRQKPEGLFSNGSKLYIFIIRKIKRGYDAIPLQDYKYNQIITVCFPENWELVV